MISVGCQFVFIEVDGCEMYCGICSSRLSVYVYFYVCVFSNDCKVCIGLHEQVSSASACIRIPHHHSHTVT